MNPIAGEMSAAGLDKRINPAVIGVFAASALIGAVGVWWVTRADGDITVEPAPPQVALIAKSPVVDEPPVAPPPPAVVPVEPPPVKVEPPVEKKDKPEKRKKHKEPRVSGPTGRLSINTVPRGLSVMLGKKKLGTTPLDTKLPLGSHSLHLVNKSLGISQTVRAEVSEIGTAEVKVVIGRGMVRVVSRPWATVYVDGAEKGRTPIQFAVYEGEHTVRLVSETGDERIFPINVKAGDQEKLITVKF
jgi:hypothetical protein